MSAPKVFLSHASEDKTRFVTNFATKLRNKGIDVWLDEWEMLLGDDLVKGVFTDGLKSCKAVIIVISKNSIHKPWVQEELSISMIKKINKEIKLIPIIIDKCEIPECLRATVWQRIHDINNYDADLERIILSIHGEKIKPNLGKNPRYVENEILLLTNLNKIDSLIIKLSCEEAVQKNDFLLNTSTIWKKLEPMDIPQEAFLDSLKILDNRGYIKGIKSIGGNIPHFEVTLLGFEEYAQVYIEDYMNLIHDVAIQLINNPKTNNQLITMTLKQPPLIIVHILTLLEANGFIKIIRSLGSSLMQVYDVSPELKRHLEN